MKGWRPACLIACVPILAALGVWLSPLAFVPVPWPDDSAFYFVGREFFKWPPRWVMLPQAPFEPTYRIFNFNTMPLYPILVGAGCLVGIDGSFWIKIWPLSAWALSGSLLVFVIFRTGLSPVFAGLVALLVALDPALRWASVLVRPESLIGLFGMALVLGLTLGFPRGWEVRGRWWDPVAALLALSAYAHFNAIHLVFPVLAVYILQPRRLFSIGLKTVLYLSPWLLVVLSHWGLFLHQMTTQWKRLAIHNGWLDSPANAVGSIFPAMGSPEPWPDYLAWAAVAFWVLILVALGVGLLAPITRFSKKLIQTGAHFEISSRARSSSLSLAPSAAWVLGAGWIWHSKPELWFIYYLHISVWCFLGLVLLFAKENRRIQGTLGVIALFCVGIFASVDLRQASRLSHRVSWKWSTYQDFVECIDTRLSALERELGAERFRVWGPTFPDVTIELSRKHPHWELTRTNDFHERSHLAIQHGHEVEAVVVTEMLNWAEREISAPWKDHPDVHSVWMEWKDYFLNRLWVDPNWKPNRYLCQRGRWQAFIFMD